MTQKRRAAMLLQWICSLLQGGKAIPVTYEQIRNDRPGVWASVNWKRDLWRDLEDLRESGFIMTTKTTEGLLFTPGDHWPLCPVLVSLCPSLVSVYPTLVSPCPVLVSSDDKALPPSPSSPFSPPLSLSPTPPLSIPTPLSPSSTPTVALQDAQVEEDKKKKEDKDDKATPGTLNLHPDLHPKSTRSRRPSPPKCAPVPLPSWEEAVAYAENFIGDGKPVPEDQRAFALDDLEWLVNRSGRLETARDWKLSINLFLRKKVSMRAKRDTATGAPTTSRTPLSAVLTLGDNKNAVASHTVSKKRALGEVLNTRDWVKMELERVRKAIQASPWSDKVDILAMREPGSKATYDSLVTEETSLKNQLSLALAELATFNKGAA